MPDLTNLSALNNTSTTQSTSSTSARSYVDEMTGDNRSTAESEKASRNTGYNKEMFLQLLVAEMKYQDPLQPSENSEYITQFAQFSQVETINTISEQMETVQGKNLVGKFVQVKTEDDKFITGMVDFVKSESDGMKVSIDDKLYSIDDIQQIYDDNYYGAVSAAKQIKEYVANLPAVEDVTLGNEEDIAKVTNVLQSLSNYDLQFIAQDDLSKIQKLQARIAELKKIQEGADITTDTTTETTGEG